MLSDTSWTWENHIFVIQLLLYSDNYLIATFLLMEEDYFNNLGTW